METRGGIDGTAVGTTVGVATALEELKSSGSALLVVGEVPEEVYARVSGCMLGDEDDEPRRRLVVEQGSSPDVRFESIDRWTPEWTRILQCGDLTQRSAAAASGANGGSPFDFGSAAGVSDVSLTPSASNQPADVDAGGIGGSGFDFGRERTDASVVVDGSVAELGVEIADAIEQFDAVAGGLAPAELRVAFDCVAPLLSTYGERTVFRFLHLFANNVRLVGGMGHVRLPKPLESETTRLLEPLFDAVVELRLDGTEAQQRWHFRDADVTSEWLPLDWK